MLVQTKKKRDNENRTMQNNCSEVSAVQNEQAKSSRDFVQLKGNNKPTHNCGGILDPIMNNSQVILEGR